jgi:hypothetical protein
MKYLKLLVISIFLGLNVYGAGWHDAGSFVAWPATNHLRWVDNVGSYTNESAWTNSGYGLWTNNYYMDTNWFLGHTEIYTSYGPFLIPFYVPDLGLGDSVATQIMANAKDARLIDCTMATRERWCAATGDHPTNFYLSFGMAGDEGFYDHHWVYRHEAQNIKSLKAVLKYICTSFGRITYTNSVPVFTNWTVDAICAASSVPSNYFDYTTSRMADMSSGVYPRIYTNIYLLKYDTNTLINSAGESFTAIGIAGTYYTNICTNANIQSGSTIDDYGWDGMRRVITNMYATETPVTWGVGYGTNWSKGYSSNFPAGYIGDFAGGTISGIVDFAEIEGDATNAFTQLKYESDTWEWRLSHSLTSGVALQLTNVAPNANAYASWSFSQNLRYYWRQSSPSADRAAYTDGTNTYLLGTNFAYDVYNSWYSHERAHTNYWKNYAAPMVYSNLADVDRVVIMTGKSNGNYFVTYSNNLASTVSVATSSVVSISQPSLDNFGVRAWSGDDNYFAGELLESLYPYRYVNFIYVCNSWPSNTLTGTNNYGSGYGGKVTTESTNIALPTITAQDAIQIWDFEYK